MLSQGLAVLMDILQQCGQGSPLMVRGDLPSRPAPEPLDPVGVGIIGWRVNDPQVVLPLGEPLAHQLRARRCMGPQVVHEYQRQASSGSRPGDGRPHLGTKDIGGASWGQSAVKLARTPIDEAEAIALVVGARGLDQLLPATVLSAPDPRERGMWARSRSLALVVVSYNCRSSVAWVSDKGGRVRGVAIVPFRKAIAFNNTLAKTGVRWSVVG